MQNKHRLLWGVETITALVSSALAVMIVCFPIADKLEVALNLKQHDTGLPIAALLSGVALLIIGFLVFFATSVIIDIGAIITFSIFQKITSKHYSLIEVFDRPIIWKNLLCKLNSSISGISATIPGPEKVVAGKDVMTGKADRKSRPEKVNRKRCQEP